MSLADFFDAVGPFLRGETDVAEFRRLGPCSATDAELGFYPWLVANDQRRILQQSFPRIHTWCGRIERDWATVVAGYIQAHPPSGFTVASMGERFVEWIESQAEAFPVGFASVADLAWCRFLARTSADQVGIGWDQRLFIRTYPVDPMAFEKALDAGAALPDASPRTVLIYRHARTQRARVLAVSLPQIAALLVASDLPLEGELRFSEEVLDSARLGLVEHGVLSNEFA